MSAVEDWVRDYDDVLTGNPPLWFKTFIWVELFFHVPYFFVATWAFIRGDNRIRTISIIYATAVIVSMVPIIPEAWTRSTAPVETKMACISVYGLWLLIPILLLIRVWSDHPFNAPKEAPATKKKQ